MSELNRTAHEAMLVGVMDCVTEVWAAYVQLDEAKTIAEQGSAMNTLSNHMADLISWHPRFNPETSEIAGVFPEYD